MFRAKNRRPGHRADLSSNDAPGRRGDTGPHETAGGGEVGTVITLSGTPPPATTSEKTRL